MDRTRAGLHALAFPSSRYFYYSRKVVISRLKKGGLVDLVFAVNIVGQDEQLCSPFIVDAGMLVNSQHLITAIEIKDHRVVIMFSRLRG